MLVTRIGRRALSSVPKVALPDLDFDYGELEPYISADIMRIHHSKHHQAYVNGFNAAMEQLEAHKADPSKLIALQSALKFNGGGHVNHSIFWKNLAPKTQTSEAPGGLLLKDIENTFGSFESFKSKLSTACAGVQGSGWGWLAYNPSTGRLEITTMANQDPLVITGMIPLLGIDVWEHAYYLQYKNVRPDYLKAIWNVIHWKDVEARYAQALHKNQ